MTIADGGPQISAAKIRGLAAGGYLQRAEPVVPHGRTRHRQDPLATGLYVALRAEPAGWWKRSNVSAWLT